MFQLEDRELRSESDGSRLEAVDSDIQFTIVRLVCVEEDDTLIPQRLRTPYFGSEPRTGGPRKQNDGLLLAPEVQSVGMESIFYIEDRIMHQSAMKY